MGDGFVASWYDTRDGHAEIYARVLNGNGVPRGPELRLTNGTDDAYEGDVAAVAGRIVVAWYEKPTSGSSRAKLGLWTADGTPQWTILLGDPDRNGRNALVRVRGSELFCAWIEDAGGENAEIWAAWYNVDGKTTSAPQRLAIAGKTTWNLNAVLNREGEAIVVFDARVSTDNDELFMVVVAKNRVEEPIRLTADDGVPSKYPDVAIGQDGIALTWFDERDGNTEIYLLVGRLEDLHEGVEFRARRVTHTSGASIGAYVAWNGKRFGLAWCDDTEGQQEIYYQSFSEQGVVEAEPRRLTFTPTASSIPAIEPRGDGFALAWNEYAPPSPGGSPDSEIHFTTVP